MKHIAFNITWLCLGVISGFLGGFACKPCLSENVRFQDASYESQTYKLVKVVDGDTIDIADGTGMALRIRLHGIDTPERGKFYYRQASSALEALCKGQKIRLNHIGDGKFDRISANVHCGDRFANAALVEMGAAITSIKYADDAVLYKLQSQARQQCKGIWAKRIEGTYSANRLQGRSPIKGHVTLTNHENCRGLRESTP